MVQHYCFLLIEVAFRRWRTLLQTGLAVFGLIALLSIAWPPIYQSSAKILIEDNRAQLLVSPTLPSASNNQPAVMANPVSEQDLNSELALLGSRGLIEQTLADIPRPHPAQSLLSRALGTLFELKSLPGFLYRLLHSGPVPTDRQRWALQLQHDLSPWVIKRSNLIQVDFRSHDPLWARQFLTVLLAHYLDYHAALSEDPQAERFFHQQAELLKQKLTASERRLQAMELQTGITNLPEQKRELLTEIASFEATTHRNSAELAADQERVQALSLQLRANPERVTKETKIVQNMALQTLKPQVLALKTQRAELLTRYRPDSERIREIDSQLKAAQAVLAAENRTEVQESSTDLNPAWETVDTDLAQAKVAADTLAANQQELNRQVALYRGELNNLTGDEISIEGAMRDVDVNKEAYLSYVRKSEEARAAQQLNRSKILNVNVAEEPLMPLRPIFPDLPLNLAVGAVLALALGMGAAWWEEQRDSRIHSLEAIRAASGLATLAVLPEGF